MSHTEQNFAAIAECGLGKFCRWWHRRRTSRSTTHANLVFQKCLRMVGSEVAQCAPPDRPKTAYWRKPALAGEGGQAWLGWLGKLRHASAGVGWRWLGWLARRASKRASAWTGGQASGQAGNKQAGGRANRGKEGRVGGNDSREPRRIGRWSITRCTGTRPEYVYPPGCFSEHEVPSCLSGLGFAKGRTGYGDKFPGPE